jgi:hypothetical protein
MASFPITNLSSLWGQEDVKTDGNRIGERKKKEFFFLSFPFPVREGKKYSSSLQGLDLID